MSSIAGEVAGKIKQVQAEKKAVRTERDETFARGMTGQDSPWNSDASAAASSDASSEPINAYTQKAADGSPEYATAGGRGRSPEVMLASYPPKGGNNPPRANRKWPELQLNFSNVPPQNDTQQQGAQQEPLEQQKAAIRAIGRTREMEAGAVMAGLGALATFFGLVGMFLDEVFMSLGISAYFAGGIVLVLGVAFVATSIYIFKKTVLTH